jgi:hypothetical protein
MRDLTGLTGIDPGRRDLTKAAAVDSDQIKERSSDLDPTAAAARTRTAGGERRHSGELSRSRARGHDTTRDLVQGEAWVVANPTRGCGEPD